MKYVDLLFCHRPDPETPIEETVWAMNDIIASGKALYWGTSEWSAEQIRQAWEIADKRNLRKPQMEQPQYNMLVRTKVEKQFARLYDGPDGIGLGLTTFSPLASGLLSGKYKNGIPKDSRFALPGFEWLQEQWYRPEIVESIEKLRPIAESLGATMSQLAIAWVAHNPHVSTVITGASRLAQLEENLGALDVLPKLTSEVLKKIDEALAPILRMSSER